MRLYDTRHEGDKISHRQRAEVFIRAQANTDRTGFDVFVADDEHIRDMTFAGFTDFATHTGFTLIHFDTEAKLLQLFGEAVSVFKMLVRDGDDDGLHRRKPCWECTSKMLDQDADETF